EGLRLRLRRYPPGFDAEVARAQARLEWTPQQRSADRRARLRTMLIHAGRHVPYWRELFARLGFRPERVQHEDELAVLPRLTKDVILAEGPRMWADEVPPWAGRAQAMMTSGTTGAGLHLRVSRSALRQQWAVCWRHRLAHGIARGTWSAQLGGRVVVPPSQRGGPYHRINVSGRQLLLSGYHLGPHSAPDYLDQIEQRDIPWIHGYPSLVVQLAEAAREAGRRLPALRWVTLASETVTPAQRATIEAGLGVMPREHYAQTEAVANASEGPDGQLRLDDDFSVVELRPEPALGDPTLRRIVGTSLDNWHQPFIRYDTGDLATLDPGLGEAGDDGVAPGRPLRAIDGRCEDYVELASGARVGRTDHVFKALTFVREAQIRQHRAGAIEVHVVPRGAWAPEHEAALRSEIALRMGEDLTVGVVLCDRLPRTSRGKLRLVVRRGA
ncbi:MAG: phenylacetate--CoA ligase family protein, partial [Myxococcales bacterium]|nr:phenylacetate--CoA ligase family protein [Myxococcales bacterium]